jgi:ATP-dependent RNA helicase DeaD
MTTLDNFQSLGLPEALLQSLEHLKYTKPTPIQAAAIPVAIEGRDILGSAQTGSGKTAAFIIPLAKHLLENPNDMALVLLPTRELATQVAEFAKQLFTFRSKVKSALLIGGEPMPKQFQQLRARPQLIIGTPGRVNDHLARGTLALHQARFLVLDETDRMLDMGFGIQLKEIMKYVPQERQTLMFSATLPPEIVTLTKQYLKNPQRISVDAVNDPGANITQESKEVSKVDKYQEFLKELQKREGSVIVFVKTKIGAEKLAEKLRRLNLSSDYIHGDLKQSRRDKVIRSFRNKQYRIMIATDVAARGLDVPHIEHVINYDLPQCPEDYIHRIGRTGRAGAKGHSLSFITPDDYKQWRLIQKYLNPNAKPANNSANNNEPRNRDFNAGNGDNKRRPFKGKSKRPFFGSRKPRQEGEKKRAFFN